MRIVLTLLLIFAASNAYADSALNAPERFTTCSQTGATCATSDPSYNVTWIHPKGKPKQVLWAIPGWHRDISVSNDGESVVLGHHNLNLVDLDATMAEPMLRFYHRAKLVRTVRLGDLVRSKDELDRTESHYFWGITQGFDAQNRFRLELLNRKIIRYDPRTGMPVR